MDIFENYSLIGIQAQVIGQPFHAPVEHPVAIDGIPVGFVAMTPAGRPTPPVNGFFPRGRTAVE